MTTADEVVRWRSRAFQAEVWLETTENWLREITFMVSQIDWDEQHPQDIRVDLVNVLMPWVRRGKDPASPAHNIEAMFGLADDKDVP